VGCRSQVMDTPFGDTAQTVFIPSRELTGTREAKRMQTR